MKKLIMLVAFLLPLECLAVDKHLIMGAFSKHTEEGYRDGYEYKEYNENNPMIAVEVNGFVIGEMLNSYYEETTFVGYHHRARVLGILVMASNKYRLSPLPRVGSFAVGGFLTAQVGPVLLLAVPNNVYAIALKLKL